MNFCGFCVTNFIAVVLISINSVDGASLNNSETIVNFEEEKNPESQIRDERAAGYRRPQPKKGDHITCTVQGKIAMKRECYRYFICARPGVPATEGKCPAKKVFHHQQRNCLKLPKTECEHSWCKKPTDKFPDPYSKMRYLSCKHMYPEVMECPKNQIYDIRKKDCVDVNRAAVTELIESDEKEEGGGGNIKNAKKPSQTSWARMMEITNLEAEQNNSNEEKESKEQNESKVHIDSKEKKERKEEKSDVDPDEEAHLGHTKYS